MTEQQPRGEDVPEPWLVELKAQMADPSVVKCCVCTFPITDGVMVGMGDGTGQRFGHRSCYWRTKAEQYEVEIAALRTRLEAGVMDVLRYRCDCPKGLMGGEEIAQALVCAEQEAGFNLELDRLRAIEAAARALVEGVADPPADEGYYVVPAPTFAAFARAVRGEG